MLPKRKHHPTGFTNQRKISMVMMMTFFGFLSMVRGKRGVFARNKGTWLMEWGLGGGVVDGDDD